MYEYQYVPVCYVDFWQVEEEIVIDFLFFDMFRRDIILMALISGF